MEFIFVLLIFLIVLREIDMDSLNKRVKSLEETVKSIIGVTEEKVTEIASNIVRPVHDRTEEIATYTGVDEDKPQPTPPTQPQ